jgi:hypothetical protein
MHRSIVMMVCRPFLSILLLLSGSIDFSCNGILVHSMHRIGSLVDGDDH